MSHPSVDGVNPFSEPGEWLKCALHTHSTVSDGTLPPQQLVTTYEEAGFDVVAITDHWRRTLVPSTERIVTIPSAELGFDLRHPVYPRHSGEFLVYGIDDIPEDPGGDRANWYVNEEDNYEVRTFPDLDTAVGWADAQGAVVYVAHPYWSGMDVRDLVEAQGYAGIELFNGSAEVETGRGDSSTWWDVLLSSGRRVFGVGTDDQHYPLFELGTGWTMVRTAERTPAAVLDALRNGHAYVSHGPQILDVVVGDSFVEVACSPSRAVVLHMEEEQGASVVAGVSGRRMGRILDTDGNGLITRARVETTHESPRYRRISVVDATGRRAWTNPL